MNIKENNRVKITGFVTDDFEFNHEVHGEKFYMTYILVERTSGVLDRIPIMVSERLVDVKKDWARRMVAICGQFRSFNTRTEEKRKLILYVFATELEVIEHRNNCINEITLDGYICKPSVYRKTPLGREIADLLLAVNRPYGKSDYIPCICWGRNARYVSTLDVGEHILLIGRIQSRNYGKRISETQYETRIAYEVSANALEVSE